MKRGLITWDHQELPPQAFVNRLDAVRAALLAQGPPAMLVYTDVWRSNRARFFTNYMPYWNRSLAVIPQVGEPVLLCGLSPRVYPWIRSTTVFEEIRPAKNLVQSLVKLCEEHKWKELGVLELDRLPYEIHQPLAASGIRIRDVAVAAADDPAQIEMYRRASALASQVLTQELPHGAGLTDHQFSGRLERAFRRAGAEDLIILISTGETVPRTACGALLGDTYSVSVHLEYRGHWVKYTRARAPEAAIQLLERKFAESRKQGGGLREDGTGSYPFELGQVELGQGGASLHVELADNGRRLFYGETVLDHERS